VVRGATWRLYIDYVLWAMGRAATARAREATSDDPSANHDLTTLHFLITVATALWAGHDIFHIQPHSNYGNRDS